MIVDRYDPINLFEELVPKLKLQMEPELAHLDRLLDDEVLFERLSKRTLLVVTQTPASSGGTPPRWRSS